MREIKFRAFLPQDKKIVEVEELDIKRQVFHFWHPEFGAAKHSIDEQNGILMQFTGLLDKSGKEIYEGDILKTPAGDGVVKWRGGCYRICWNEKEGTTLHDTPPSKMEVIGNIYENPNLIK